MRQLYLLLPVAWTLVVVPFLCGCVDEEDFPTPAGATIEFSVDTLSFDTVIAGLGTATHNFRIYNNSGDGISITDVGFEDDDSRGFRVNVDGMYINDGLAQSIDCRDEDSLIVFVELTPEETGSDTPVEITTQLIFTLANGEEQSIVLEAYSQDVVTLKALHVTADTLLSASRPFLVYDSLTVAEGATLTIDPGQLFYFYTDAYMRIDGTLLAEGTLDEPIVMRGHRTEMMFENQPYDRVSDQWVGLTFGPLSYGNELIYCDIHSAHDGIVTEAGDSQSLKLLIENSIVHNMAGYCLRLINSNVVVGNSQITNAADNCVYIAGGSFLCVHSTIANFYPFDSDRGAALVYSNYEGDETFDLNQATFINCIVTGWSDDEVYAYQTGSDGVAFNYSFYSCLLNTPEVDDDLNIVDCIWDRPTNDVAADDNFKDFNLDYLTFDFSLSEESPAVGIGNVSYTQAYYPTDRLGVLRLSDGTSDAGCYELVQSTDQ